MITVKHEEYSIVVLAPWSHGLCQYAVDQPWACQNAGSHAIKVINDRDEVLLQYSNICSSHLLMVVIDQLMTH